jgi:hypothetical protein
LFIAKQEKWTGLFYGSWLHEPDAKAVKAMVA